MSAGKAFLFANAALIAGVAVASLTISTPFLIYIIGVALFIVLAFLALKKKFPIIALIAVCLGFSIGCIRFTQSVSAAKTHFQTFLNQQAFEVRGDVTGVSQSGKQITADVKIAQLGKIQIRTYSRGIQAGDAVKFLCRRVQKPFSLRAFAAQNVFAICDADEILAQEKSRHLSVKILATSLAIRKKLSSIINRAIPSPEAELIEGIVLGQKQNLPQELQQALQKTGTTHIVVLSGYNIAILVAVFSLFFRSMGIGIRKTTFITIGVTAVFIVLTGFSAPAIRAGLLCAVALLGKSLGRKINTAALLIITAAFMIVAHPTLLGWSMSFQLSFLATFGVLFSEKIERYFTFLPSTFAIRSSVCTTICATVLTLPIIAFGFGTISIVSVLVNALIVPLVPIVMAAGAIVVCIGLFFPAAAIYAGSIPFVVARIMTWCIESFAELSFSSVTIGKVHWVFLLLWYIGLFLLVKKIKSRESESQHSQQSQKASIVLVSGLAAIGMCVAVAILFPKSPQSSMSFFDVGQGDASHVRTRSGFDMLIDGGPDNTILSRLGRDMPYFDRKIDVLALTHPHSDHMTGLVSVLKKYDVQEVWVSQSPPQMKAADFFDEIKKQNIPIYTQTAGEQIAFENNTLQISIFSPTKNSISSDINDQSLVLGVAVPQLSVMFMGDASKKIEQEILKTTIPHNFTILKVGHHGSKNSSSEAWLSVVNPHAAVISSGKGNAYGHPHKETLALLRNMGIEIFRTDLCGSIRFIVTPNNSIEQQAFCTP